MFVPKREESANRFESRFATDYLGHFHLFELLKDTMLKASTPGFNSRLVNISSTGHHASEIEFDDFQLFRDGAYDPAKAYGQSKLAQMYLANYVDHHYGPKGLHALSLMPGGIRTNLQKHIPEDVKTTWDNNPQISNFMRLPEQSAATTVFTAVSKEWEGKGRKHMEDCRIATTEPLLPSTVSSKEYAYDALKEERLWKLTLETLELEPSN